MSLSKAVIMGAVARNPEKRYTSNNIPVTSFSINIGKEEEPSLVRVIAKGKLAETSADKFSKDDMVIVEGRLQTATVKTTTGEERKVIEIDARAIEVVGQVSLNNQQNESSVDYADEINGEDLIGEDEIPF